MNKIYLGIITLLIISLIWMRISNANNINNVLSDLNESTKKVVSLSKTIKEQDGQYSRLIDTYNTQNELNKKLLTSNKDLYKQIRSNGERLHQLSDIIATFENKSDSGVVNGDDSIINMSIFYPDKNDWFINWSGSIFVNDKVYKGNWEFDDITLQAIITEEENGLWRGRVIGPDFLVIDSISVNSLPIVQKKDKKIKLFMGMGYYHSMDDNPSSIKISSGVSWKNKTFISLGVTTDKKLGLSYFYQLN